jgi:competence protein ComEA
MPTDRRLVLLVLAAGLALVVVFGKVLAPSEPAADPISTGAAPALSLPAAGASDDAGPVLVHVVGAVRHAGVYKLAGGSRVRDAIRRAGGARAGARLQEINLAERLADGEQVVVPGRGVTVSAPQAGGPGAIVHLSSATAEQLATLDGIGPALAERIVAYRQAHGGFRSVDQLGDVPGIGPVKLEALRGHVAP